MVRNFICLLLRNRGELSNNWWILITRRRISHFFFFRSFQISGQREIFFYVCIEGSTGVSLMCTQRLDHKFKLLLLMFIGALICGFDSIAGIFASPPI